MGKIKVHDLFDEDGRKRWYDLQIDEERDYQAYIYFGCPIKKYEFWLDLFDP